MLMVLALASKTPSVEHKPVRLLHRLQLLHVVLYVIVIPSFLCLLKGKDAASFR